MLAACPSARDVANLIMTSMTPWRTSFGGKVNSSSRLAYRSYNTNDGTFALEFAGPMYKNKLANVVVLSFFINEARNFWDTPRISVRPKI